MVAKKVFALKLAIDNSKIDWFPRSRQIFYILATVPLDSNSVNVFLHTRIKGAAGVRPA